MGRKKKDITGLRIWLDAGQVRRLIMQSLGTNDPKAVKAAFHSWDSDSYAVAIDALLDGHNAQAQSAAVQAKTVRQAVQPVHDVGLQSAQHNEPVQTAETTGFSGTFEIDEDFELD